MPFSILWKGPLENPRFWITLGWLDVVQSYRRTFLGPLWITANLAIFATAMTLVYGALFGVPTREYSAYLLCGMIGWIWVTALLVEVGNTFIAYSHYIKGMAMDKMQLVWATACKQLIVLGHNLVVYAVLVVLGVVKLNFYTLQFIPAVVLFFLMSIPLTAVSAMLFARYRDLPRLMTSVILLVMLTTPIFWMPNMITGWRALLIHLNPVYYFVEFLRRPLLGEPLTPLIIGVMCGFTAFSWIFGAWFVKRYQRNVAFWI